MTSEGCCFGLSSARAGNSIKASPKGGRPLVLGVAGSAPSSCPSVLTVSAGATSVTKARAGVYGLGLCLIASMQREASPLEVLLAQCNVLGRRIAARLAYQGSALAFRNDWRMRSNWHCSEATKCTQAALRRRSLLWRVSDATCPRFLCNI